MATPKSVFAHAQSYFVKMTKYKVVPKKKFARTGGAGPAHVSMHIGGGSGRGG